MKKILSDAANIGAVTARTIGYKLRDKDGFIYPGSYWRKTFFGGYKFEVSPGVSNLDGATFLLLPRNRRHASHVREDGRRGIRVSLDGPRR
jgi:hypothetical protein